MEMTVEVVVVEVAAAVLAIRFCCCCWPFRSDATSNVNRNAFGNLIASFSSGGSGGRGERFLPNRKRPIRVRAITTTSG